MFDNRRNLNSSTKRTRPSDPTVDTEMALFKDRYRLKHSERLACDGGRRGGVKTPRNVPPPNVRCACKQQAVDVLVRSWMLYRSFSHCRYKQLHAGLPPVVLRWPRLKHNPHPGAVSNAANHRPPLALQCSYTFGVEDFSGNVTWQVQTSIPQVSE